MSSYEEYEDESEIDSCEIKPKKDTQFWVYTLNKKLWDEYNKSTDASEDDGMFISSYENQNLKEGDIVFYYLKDFKKSGFIGISQVCSDQTKNSKKIKVFNDKNLNKNVVRIGYLTIFENPVRVDTIFNIIKHDSAGLRSKSSFTSKYLKKIARFEKFNFNGERLLEKLYEVTSIEETESSELIETPKKSIAKKLKKENIKLMDKTESYSESCSEIESCSEVSQNEESQDAECGEIPILISPCNEFSWPKNKNSQKKYFIEHFKSCRNCDVTDNNNSRIGAILDSAKIEYYVVKTNRDPYFEIPLEDYFALKRHDPLDAPDNVNSFIRICRIDNGDEIYQNCILLTWVS